MGTFTETEKVDVRRHAGYPAYGSGNAHANLQGYRFFAEYGVLEFKLNNLDPTEETVVRTYITNLNQLETDIYGVRSNLDTAAASVWTRNPSEHSDREALYKSWAMALCGFLGQPPGPNMRGASRNVPLMV